MILCRRGRKKLPDADKHNSRRPHGATSLPCFTPALELSCYHEHDVAERHRKLARDADDKVMLPHYALAAIGAGEAGRMSSDVARWA